MTQSLSATLIASIFVGGGTGALMRFLISKAANSMTSRIWLGTFIVNMLGCLIFFCLLKWAPSWSKNMDMAVKTGVLGSLTTFSTFSVEVVTLLKSGRWPEAIGVVLLNVIFGIIIGISVLR